MTTPDSANSGEHFRETPLVTWKEPSPVAYRVVELPPDQNTGVRLPPLEWVARPAFADAPDIATPQEKEEAFYRTAGPIAEDPAKVQHREYQETRLKEQLLRSRKLGKPTGRRPPVREKHWYQCLATPLMAWRVLLALAVGLGLSTILLLPLSGNSLLPWHIRYLLPLAFAVLTCGYLQCVLNGAVAGDPPTVVWPGRQFHIALRYSASWAYCFLAGPGPLLMAATFYWVYCGEMEFLDWLILAQVGILATGYFLFALLALTRSKHLYDVNPLRIARLVHALGYRSAVAVLLASWLAYEHGRLILFAVGEAHEDAFAGWFLLMMYWLSALASFAFLLRLVGWWCHEHVQATPASISGSDSLARATTGHAGASG